MRLRSISRSERTRRRVDAAAAAYVYWLLECRAVRDAYRAWGCASRASASLAFVAYEAALVREENAARVYARLMESVGHLAETRRGHQVAQIPSDSEV